MSAYNRVNGFDNAGLRKLTAYGSGADGLTFWTAQVVLSWRLVMELGL